MEDTPRRAAQRANKPLTEKKRRLRINASLEQIKYLVMEAIGQDPNNITTKFEKADVLELTVRYLQNQKMTNPRNFNPALQYKEGYQTCVQDVASFLDQNDGADEELKSSMLEHLDHCMERFDKVNGLTLRRGSKVVSSGVGESMDFVDGQAQVVNQSGTSTPTPVQNIQTLHTVQTVQIPQPLQDVNQNIVQKQQPVTSKPQPVSNNQPVPVRLIRSSQTENVVPQNSLTNQTVPVQVIQTSQAGNLVPQNTASVRLPHIPVQFDQNQMSNAVFAQVLGLPPIQSFAPAQNGGVNPSNTTDVTGVYSTLVNAPAAQSSADAFQTYTVLQPVKSDPAMAQVNGEYYTLYNPEQGFAQ